MKRHHLYEVDLERLRAFCTVCGYTDIVLRKSRSSATPKSICIARAQEMQVKRLQKSELAREDRQAHPGRQSRHVLSNIDPKAMTAICAVCGPTDIWKRQNAYKGKTYYTCGTQNREYLRKYRRAHREGRSTNPHALSQINEEAGTAVCATCGPVKIEIRLVNKYVTRRCINAKKLPEPEKRKLQVDPAACHAFHTVIGISLLSQILITEIDHPLAKNWTAVLIKHRTPPGRDRESVITTKITGFSHKLFSGSVRQLLITDGNCMNMNG